MCFQHFLELPLFHWVNDKNPNTKGLTVLNEWEKNQEEKLKNW